jgi:hypothetical protein
VASGAARSSSTRVCGAARPEGPAIVDAEAEAEAEADDPELQVLPGEAAPQTLVEELRAAPEATGLLGLPLDEASAVAGDFSAAIRDAPALASLGVTPSACLDAALSQVAGEGGGPVVPARVQADRVAGRPVLAYVLVGASPGASRLDRVDVVVTDADTCAPLP